MSQEVPFAPFAHMPLQAPPNAIGMQIATCLRSILRIPLETRWVCDFLFSNLTMSPFHYNIPLAPESFKNALNMTIRQEILVPNTLFSQMSCTEAMQEERDAFHKSSTKVSTKVDTMFVPVASMDNMCVGYAFGVAGAQEEMDIGVASNPFRPPFTGRFAFDLARGDLLVVVHGGTPVSVGLKGMVMRKDVCREQYTITVPSEEYGWGFLPSRATCMLSSEEYRVGTDGGDVGEGEDDGKAGCVDDVLKYLDFVLDGDSTDGDMTKWMGENAKSHMPWFVSPAGSIADGLPVCHVQATNWTSSSAFAFDAISLSVRGIEKCLLGSFYGPFVRMDCVHALTGLCSSEFTGRITYVLEVAQDSVVGILKEAFAQLYYMSVMCLQTDGRLCGGGNEDIGEGGSASTSGTGEIFSSEAEDALREGEVVAGVDVDGGKARVESWERSTKKLAVLAPRCERVEEGGAENTVCVSDGNGGMSRERMLEERRKRNRLSAARSNHRKKERVEGMRREVEVNHVRVEQLKKRRDEVVRENAELKRRVAEMGGGAVG